MKDIYGNSITHIQQQRCMFSHPQRTGYVYHLITDQGTHTNLILTCSAEEAHTFASNNNLEIMK